MNAPGLQREKSTSQVHRHSDSVMSNSRMWDGRCSTILKILSNDKLKPCRDQGFSVETSATRSGLSQSRIARCLPSRVLLRNDHGPNLMPARHDFQAGLGPRIQAAGFSAVRHAFHRAHVLLVEMAEIDDFDVGKF